MNEEKLRFLIGTGLVVIIIAGYLIYKGPWYPGRFVYDSMHDIRCLTHSSGDCKYLIKDFDGNMESMRNEPWNTLSLSPDGKSLAYLIPENGLIAAIVVSPSETKRNSSNEVSDRLATPKIPYDVKQSHIPYYRDSNLEWSPDGRYLAYTTLYKLYILDRVTKKVESIALPKSKNIEEMMAAWREYNKGDFNPAKESEETRQVKKTLKAAIKKEGTDNAVTGSEESAGPFFANINKSHQHDKLSPSAQQIVKKAESRIWKRFHISKKLAYSLLDEWQYYYDYGSVQVNGKSKLYKIFFKEGRMASWISANTIYCDNLRVNLARDKAGKLQAKVVKIPLPCEFFARPVWSPKGDKAAYIIPAWYSKNQKDDNSFVLVIVNKHGKVLNQCFVPAPSNIPRWSRDGKYVATRSRYSNHGLLSCFNIYDANTLRHWRAPARGGVDVFNDWDWDTN